jgi:hypothetical protein
VPGDISVLAGQPDLGVVGGVTIGAAEIHVHPRYRGCRQIDASCRPDHDIALLRLQQPFAADLTIPSIARRDETWPSSFPAFVPGWGIFDESGPFAPFHLQLGRMPVLGHAGCVDLLGALYDASTMHCAGQEGSETVEPVAICAGDSGGPLLVEGGSGPPSGFGRGRGPWRVLGVTSFGPIPCTAGPGVFTSVAAHLSWIDLVRSGLLRFDDVAADNPHRAAIERLAAAFVTQATGAYRPGELVTRAQMASFLLRALELPPATGPCTRFSDVPPTDPHACAIQALAERGLVAGGTDGRYRPLDPVSRAEMAVFLVRALQLPLGAVPPPDSASHPHAASIGAVMAAGVATGFADGTYRPDLPVSRDQMASFLVRAFLPPPVGPA